MLTAANPKRAWRAMPSPSASERPTPAKSRRWPRPRRHGARRRRRADDRRGRRPLPGARRLRDPRGGRRPRGAAAVADAARPDLVVLDVMLPGIDGIEVMRQLHERPGRRGRGDPADRARRGVRPPGRPAPRRRRLRRQALLAGRARRPRRRGPAPRLAARGRGGAPPIEHGPLRIDPATRRVILDGEEVALTQREFDLLAYLAAHPGRVFSRDQLMEAVWG